MMNRKFQESVLSHGECLLAERYDEIVPCYQEVLPVFVEGRAILIDGHDALRGALVNHRERLVAESVTRSVGTVYDREQIERKRFRFVVDWDYYTDIHTTPKLSSAAYFCVQRDGKTLIEMVEYKKIAFPNISGWKRFNITSSQSNDTVTSGYLH
jgi:hypothetical protein